MKTTSRKTSATQRVVPRPFAMPWGKGDIVEEATASGQWSRPAIQLLRYEDGTEAVRFCQYDERGRFRRSPMMISRELARDLGRSLATTPRLKRILDDLIAASGPREKEPKRKSRPR